MQSIDETTDVAISISRRQTMENNAAAIVASYPSSQPPPQQSFYRKYIANNMHGAPSAVAQQSTQSLSTTFSSIDPSTIIAILQNSITMQNRQAGKEY
jgi:hypothetical protein